MPQIEVNVDTYVDVDIDVTEVLDECSESEIKDVLVWLEDSGYLLAGKKVDVNANYDETDFDESVMKLSHLYLQIKPEEWAMIKSIIDKY